MPDLPGHTEKKVFQKRLELKRRQIEALENQRDLTLDEGQKVILEEKVSNLWKEIADLERELAAIDATARGAVTIEAEWKENKSREGSASALPGLPNAQRMITGREKAAGEAALRLDERPVSMPGLFRYILDRYFPRVHTWLTTRVGLFRLPPEWRVLHDYLTTLRSMITDDISAKTYIEPRAKDLPESASLYKAKRTGFLTPIQQLIKEIVGVSQGGDAQSAQISAISKKSKFVRNIVRRLLRASEPLILLGDPGTGKSITLQQAAMLIAERESKKIFPHVCLFIRLGEFQVSGAVDSQAVWDYVKKSAPKEISPFLDSLDGLGRLVIFFDGMDEMSRERYNEYTAALSVFSGKRRGFTKTLFSCRITDFTPRFQHNRLVLLPFDRTHIYRYLKRQIPRFPIKIDGQFWSARKLANRLAQGDLPMQADNPFVLWLLCNYFQEEEEWPQSRVQLLEYYTILNYERKTRDVFRRGESLPAMNSSFFAWGHIAYMITNRNKGAAIPLEDVNKLLTMEYLPAVRVGALCGILQESMDLETRLIRFEHHRFQEYFTALYLNQEARRSSELDWLEKLDAPRWQETLFNLVLMGGGREAINVLNEAILQGLTRLKELSYEGHTLESAQEETVLADRVELTSRILHQTRSQSVSALPELHRTFQKVAYWLADHGNPITKVKMLWASKVVHGIDIFRVAREALASDVSWVRQQALIITSAVSGNVGTEALKEDLLHSFASGWFPNRLGGFVRVASALKQRRLWAVLAVGFALWLVQLLAVYGLFATARNLVPQVLLRLESAGGMASTWLFEQQMEDAIKRKDEEEMAKLKKEHENRLQAHTKLMANLSVARSLLESSWFLTIVNGAMLITLIYMLRRTSGSHFLCMQGVGYAGLFLPFLWWSIWLGDFKALVLFIIVDLMCPVFLLSAAGWVLTAFAHAFTLMLFIIAASYWMGPISKTRMLREAMWENCGFRAWGKGIFVHIGKTTAFCLILPASAALASLKWLVDWPLIIRVFGLFPYFPTSVDIALSATIYAEVIGCLVTLVSALMKKGEGWKLYSVVFLRWTARCIGLAALVFLLWGLAAVDWLAIFDWFAQNLTLFPIFPRGVNIALSAILYLEIMGCLTSLASIFLAKYRAQGLFLKWTATCTILVLIVFLVWGIAAVDWRALLKVLAEFALFPFFPLAVNVAFSVILYSELVGCCVSVISGLRWREDAWRQSLALWLDWTKTCLTLAIIIFIAWCVYTLSDYLLRIVAIMFVCLLLALCLFILWRLVRDFAGLLGVVLWSSMGPASYNDEKWRSQLRGLDPGSQATLLRRTTPEMLNLPVRDFLALLQEVEDSFQKEPALSAYWAKRYQIEQMIKQEIVG